MGKASPPRPETESLAAFRVEIHPDGDRVLVAPHGELDMETVPVVADEIEALVGRGFQTIVIDLRPVSFIDSTGVHLLLCQTARRDATITAIDGPEIVGRVFDLAGVRDVLPFEAAP